MATRFYLTNVSAGYTPATWHGAWDENALGVTRKLGTTGAGIFSDNTAVENNITNNWDIAMVRFVSDPLNAVTVSGADTLQWIAGVIENSTGANAFYHVHVWVTTGDSDTARGTLLTDNIGATEFQDVTISARAQGEGAKTLTSVAISTGDRIVIEIGSQMQNTATSDRSSTLYYGGTGSDLVNGDTTVTTKLGWMEFSTAITVASTSGGGQPRWYLTNSAATFTPSSWMGAWDSTGSALTLLLSPTAAGTATTIGIAETSTTNLWDVALARFVSEPLTTATIATNETISWMLGFVESSSSANDFTHVHAWVSVGSTSVVRGTLITDSIGATEVASATPAAMGDGAKALSAVSITAGDRIIVEIGYQGQNTSATSFTGTLNYGGTGSSPNLSLRDTSVTTHPGWIDFSSTVSANTSTGFTQSLTASIGFTGAFVKQTRHPIAAGLSFTGAMSRAIKSLQNASLSFTGALTKFTRKSALTAGLSFTGALARNSVLFKSFTAAVSFTGNFVKRTNATKTAGLSFTGAINNRISKFMTAGLSFVGALTKFFRKTSFTASLSFVGSFTKRTIKSLTGGVSFTGVMAYGSQFFRALTASVGFTGAISRAVAKKMSANASFTGNFTKLTRKTPFTASISFVGTIAKQAGKVLAGAVSFTGAFSLSNVFKKALTASVGFTGNMNRRISKNMTAGLSFTGAFKKALSKSLTATLSFVGSVVKKTTQRYTAGLSFVGSFQYGSLFKKALTAAVSFTGSFAKRTNKRLSGGVSFVGSIIKSGVHFMNFVASVGFTGNLAKRTRKTFAAGLSFTGFFKGIVPPIWNNLVNLIIGTPNENNTLTDQSQQQLQTPSTTDTLAAADNTEDIGTIATDQDIGTNGTSSSLNE